MNKLSIHQDSNSMNPRTEWDNLGTIAYKHGNYTLGEERISDPIDWLEGMLNLNPKYIYNNDRLAELEDKFFEKYIVHKLYLYDHSGITISTSPFSCPWDSSQVGYIYVSKETAYKEYGIKRITKEWKDKILLYLEGEVETFNQYLNNDVYGFTIEDEDGYVIDSCGGFYGDDFVNNGMIEHIDSDKLGMSETELIEYLNKVDVEYA